MGVVMVDLKEFDHKPYTTWDMEREAVNNAILNNISRQYGRNKRLPLQSSALLKIFSYFPVSPDKRRPL
jgi:pyruvate-formate lyase-activating enzyme